MNRQLLIAALLVAGLGLQLMAVPPASATKIIAKEQDAACTSCHDKPGSKLMTDQGKYWELMGSFEGYDGLEASFGKCTTCHVKEPGSAKLTETGEMYRSVIEKMDAEELTEWLMKPHPMASEKALETTGGGQ